MQDTLKQLGNTPTLSEFAKAEPLQDGAYPDLAEFGKRYLSEMKAISRRSRLDAMIPESYRILDLDHPGIAKTRSQCEAVNSWDYQPRGLLLLGEHGGGKTRSAWALVHRLMTADGIDCQCYHAQDLAGRICEEIDYGADDARRFVLALASAPVLFIDDLGQEEVNRSQQGRVASWFLRIIDARLGSGKPMIITTNYGAKRMYEKYGYETGGAIARRLRDGCDIVRF